ncbi:hypothetical protein K438DRAFT_1879175 [Mycena galopus ATCC 62051]|nr:hypothetical protein K438DRAFT_1879175 [Mycena galopus ATCC 62051]
MPRQPTISEIRLNDTIACLGPALSLLNDLHDALGTPFIPAISTTTVSLIAAVQNAKKNKAECAQLLENILQVLYAILNVHVKSETAGSIEPAMFHEIGRFAETLHKIHTFVEAQTEGNRIKSFFRQSEMTTLLKDSRESLKHAMQVFKIESGSTILGDIGMMQKTAETMHKELLLLISKLSDETSSVGASSVYTKLNNSSSLTSSNSFSMLPAKPKIFHGRQAELAEVVQILTQDSARIVILGPGGIGKTSLAKAALHHPDVAAKYDCCYFTSCESASTSIEVAAIISAHLDLKPGRDLTKQVLRCLAQKSSSLLILDNLETPWETEARSSVEELLSLLADIPQLALMVTMRGAERPAKVRWTRPFLMPLKPLSSEAALQTFEDIADDSHEPIIIKQLLSLTDNMPLAVALIAHLVDYEGSSSVLNRWQTDKTSILSAGSSRGSDMDVSIRISLSSPRLISSPGAMDLLSLLAMLPDGLSDQELMGSLLPIPNVLACKTVLLGTSLAYTDDRRRVRSLVPIREHMQKFHPPAPPLVQALQSHYHFLLDLYMAYQGSYQADRVNQIIPSLGNLHQLLLQGLQAGNPNLNQTIACTISFNVFSIAIGRGRLGLVDKIPALLGPEDHELHVQFIATVFRSLLEKSIDHPEILAGQAISHLEYINDPVLPVVLYRLLGYYYVNHDNVQAGMQALEQALTLATSAGNIVEQARILNMLASAKWAAAEYTAGLALAIQAQGLTQLAGNFQEEANSLWIQAGFHLKLGDYQQGLFLLQRAREHLKLCGMSDGNLDRGILNTQASLHVLKTEYTEARSIHSTTAQNTSPEQDVFRHAYALFSMGQIDVALGRTERHVEDHLENAKMLLSSIGYSIGVNECEMSLANLKLTAGDLITAKAIFEKCLEWSWGNYAEITSYCLEHMAEVRRWTTNFTWSSVYAVVYLAFAQRSQEKRAVYKALQSLGDVFLLKEDEEDAETLFTLALEGFTSMDIHRSRADCMQRLGDIMKKRGDVVKAEEFWLEARPLFERSLQANEVAQLDARLGRT